MHPSALFIPVLLAAYASAHGFVAEAHIGGHKYEGNPAGNKPKDSVIWQLSDVSPIKGANSEHLTCGHGAHQAKLVADAMPGDTMTFDWRDGDGEQHWPHDMGPLLTYMASCGSKPCSQFDPSNAKWFKIMESGMLSNGKWKQADLKNGNTIHATIPNNLAPGNYMVRNEIIALHLANQKHGAEFYVDCLQIRVGGNQNGKPVDRDTVKFPGGYSDEDPGIYVPEIYDHFNPSDYVIPGPKIASFITGSYNEDGSSDTSGQDSSSTSQDGQGSSAGKVTEGPKDGDKQNGTPKGDGGDGKENDTSSHTEGSKSADDEDCDDEDDTQEHTSDTGKEGASAESGGSRANDTNAQDTGSSHHDEQKGTPSPPALVAAASSTQSSEEKQGAQQCDPYTTRARHSSSRVYRRALAKVALAHPHHPKQLRRSVFAH